LSYPVAGGPGIEPGGTHQSPPLERVRHGGMHANDRSKPGCRTPAGSAAPTRGPLRRLRARLLLSECHARRERPPRDRASPCGKRTNLSPNGSRLVASGLHQ